MTTAALLILGRHPSVVGHNVNLSALALVLVALNQLSGLRGDGRRDRRDGRHLFFMLWGGGVGRDPPNHQVSGAWKQGETLGFQELQFRGKIGMVRLGRGVVGSSVK